MSGKRVEVRKMFTGSILSEDIYKEKGLCLLKAGEKLTEKHIESLIRHGVKHMYIK